MTDVPRNNVFCFFSSVRFFLQHGIDSDKSHEAPAPLPQVRLVPGGMFLCGEATSLSYLPVISVGQQGTTPSLAPEPQASPWTPNRRSTLDVLFLRGWLFRVCQSLLAPECVKKPEPGRNSICKIRFYGVVSLVLSAGSAGLPHEAERAGQKDWTITRKHGKVNLVFS